MGKRIKYEFGDKVGTCYYVFETEPRVSASGQSKRMAMFKCVGCGKLFEAYVNGVRSGKTKSCGCFRRAYSAKKARKHGLSSHPIYAVWSNMIARCTNKNNKQYPGYGGRGITVCPEWLNDFKVFHHLVSKLPGYGVESLTLDRIDNNGNYEPGNVRWATKHIQSINRRRETPKTGYLGVVEAGKRFISQITVFNKTHYLGTFDTIVEALDVRNNYIISNNLTEYKIQSHDLRN